MQGLDVHALAVAGSAATAAATLLATTTVAQLAVELLAADLGAHEHDRLVRALGLEDLGELGRLVRRLDLQ